MRNLVRAQAIGERNQALHGSGASRKEFSLLSLELQETTDLVSVRPQSPAGPRLNGQSPRDAARTNDVQRRYLDPSRVPCGTQPRLPASSTRNPSVRERAKYGPEPDYHRGRATM